MGLAQVAKVALFWGFTAASIATLVAMVWFEREKRK
ncbi:MAG: hypothetical protein [Mu-like cryoconite phage AB09]|nr:MAG: hypothetical protein [Mu-like cryoconite phage AB09]